MNNKPAIFVTRKLPQAVEARLERDYQAAFNLDDRLYSADAPARRSRQAPGSARPARPHARDRHSRSAPEA